MMARVRQNLSVDSISAPLPAVLVVEDDADSPMVLSCLFEGLPCHLHKARDGYTGLAIARRERPALILLDIVLPEFSGLDLLAALKQDSHLRQIPVIAVTALVLPRDREQILAAGCDGYLSKPYALDDIEVLVSTYLECVPLGTCQPTRTS